MKNAGSSSSARPGAALGVRGERGGLVALPPVALEDRRDVGVAERCEGHPLAAREDRRREARGGCTPTRISTVSPARLLERLQERVLRLRREELGVVDDADLGTARERAEAELALELAHLLDRDVPPLFRRARRSPARRDACRRRSCGRRRRRRRRRTAPSRSGGRARARGAVASLPMPAGPVKTYACASRSPSPRVAEERDRPRVAADLGEAMPALDGHRARRRRAAPACHRQASPPGRTAATPCASSHASVTCATSALTLARSPAGSRSVARAPAPRRRSARKPSRTRSWNAASSAW